MFSTQKTLTDPQSSTPKTTNLDSSPDWVSKIMPPSGFIERFFRKPKGDNLHFSKPALVEQILREPDLFEDQEVAQALKDIKHSNTAQSKAAGPSSQDQSDTFAFKFHITGHPHLKEKMNNNERAGLEFPLKKKLPITLHLKAGKPRENKTAILGVQKAKEFFYASPTKSFSESYLWHEWARKDPTLAPLMKYTDADCRKGDLRLTPSGTVRYSLSHSAERQSKHELRMAKKREDSNLEINHSLQPGKQHEASSSAKGIGGR